MKSKPRNAVILVSLLLLLSRVTLADLTIKMRVKEGKKPASQYTIRFKGNRQRNDFGLQPGRSVFSWLYQCDKRQVIGINYTDKRYFVHTLGLTASHAVAFNESQLPPKWPLRLSGRGMLNQTVIVNDTGERREMFGYTARHIKTATIREARPSCNQTKVRQETDGWYVDLLYGVECSPDLSGLSSQSYNAPYSKCDEQYNKKHYEFHSQTTGEARFGFPLVLTRTAYGDEGKPLVNYQEVVELSTTELDNALFEVPAEFVARPITLYRSSLFDRVFSLMGRR